MWVERIKSLTSKLIVTSRANHLKICYKMLSKAPLENSRESPTCSCDGLQVTMTYTHDIGVCPLKKTHNPIMRATSNAHSNLCVCLKAQPHRHAQTPKCPMHRHWYGVHMPHTPQRTHMARVDACTC